MLQKVSNLKNLPIAKFGRIQMVVEALILIARQQNGGKLLLNVNVRIKIDGAVLLCEWLLVHGLQEGVESVAFQVAGVPFEAAVLCLVILLIKLGCQRLGLDDHATFGLK